MLIPISHETKCVYTLYLKRVKYNIGKKQIWTWPIKKCNVWKIMHNIIMILEGAITA